MGKPQVRHRAIFLDRDGVLNQPIIRAGKPYPPATIAEFELYEGARKSCARLKAVGFILIVITNQPDVGRATQSRETVEAFHQILREAIPVLDQVEVCFHGGEEHGQPCDCRKPKPGMILRAAAAWNIDLTASYVIGDRWRDIDCARAAGCRAIFLDHGYEEPLRAAPDFIVRSLAEAVDVVLREATPHLDSMVASPTS